jgi:hypothetical protein
MSAPRIRRRRAPRESEERLYYVVQEPDMPADAVPWPRRPKRPLPTTSACSSGGVQ